MASTAGAFVSGVGACSIELAIFVAHAEAAVLTFPAFSMRVVGFPDLTSVCTRGFNDLASSAQASLGFVGIIAFISNDASSLVLVLVWGLKVLRSLP